MGLKMAGALAGLGQGIAGMGQAWAQGQEQDRLNAERQRQAQMQAMQMALQQATFEQNKQGQAFEQAKVLAGLLPEGTPLDAATRGRQEAGGFGALVKPDMSFGATEPGGLPNVPVTEGMPTPGMGAPTMGMPGVFDTGKGTSIATEDSATRRSAMTQQAAMQRTMARLDSQQRIAAQRATLQAQHDQIVKALGEASTDARRAGDRMQLGAALASVQQRYAALAQQEREFGADEEYRLGPGLDILNRRGDISEYRALNPPAQGGGASLDAMGRSVAGGGSAAPAPTAPTVPPAGGDVKKIPKIPSTGKKRQMRNNLGGISEYDPDTGQWTEIKPPPAHELANSTWEALFDVRAIHELDWSTQGIAAGGPEQSPPVAVLERPRRRSGSERSDQWGLPLSRADC